MKNVTVADARITGYMSVGGIVGNSDGCVGEENVCIVQNCHATATVALHAVRTTSSDFGGIVGYAIKTNVSGCSSAVTLTSKTGCYHFGGIAGCANDGTLRNNLAIGATIPNLHFKDDYYDYDASGAIVGYGDATLEHNYYSGCTVGTATTGIGSGYDINGSNDRHDITANDGAVPAVILSDAGTSLPALAEGEKVAVRREFKGGKASTVVFPFDYTPDRKSTRLNSSHL